jgi:hypothetical protein
MPAIFVCIVGRSNCRQPSQHLLPWLLLPCIPLQDTVVSESKSKLNGKGRAEAEICWIQVRDESHGKAGWCAKPGACKISEMQIVSGHHCSARRLCRVLDSKRWIILAPDAPLMVLPTMSHRTVNQRRASEETYLAREQLNISGIAGKQRPQKQVS